MISTDNRYNIFVGALVLAFVVLLAVLLASLLDATSGEVSQAIASVFGSLVAAIVAAVIVAWQVSRQGKDAIAAAKESEALSLKTDIYRDLTKAVRDTGYPIAEFNNYVRSFSTNCELIASGVPLGIPRHRSPALSDLYQDLRRVTNALIGWIENWRIIEPKLGLFQEAINSANHDVSEAYIEYTRVAVTAYPIDIPNASSPKWSLPSPEKRQDLQRLADDLEDKVHTLSSFVDDFRDQMQRQLLGGLFSTLHLKKRRPLLARYVVLDLDNYENLMKHFSQTAWGKMRTETEKRTRAQAEASNEPLFKDY